MALKWRSLDATATSSGSFKAATGRHCHWQWWCPDNNWTTTGCPVRPLDVALLHAPLYRRRSHQSDAPFTTAVLQVVVASVVLNGWIFMSTLKRHEQPNSHLRFVLSTLGCAENLRFGTIIAKLNEMADGNFTSGAAWRKP